MKSKIENIVKFGLPLIVMLSIIYSIFIMGNAGGDPEFGAIGASDSFLLLLSFLLILYFIAGIIVWIVAKKNLIFLSALFSILIAIATIFISMSIKYGLS